MIARVGIVVLAAGASTRMGRPKQMLPWHGESLLRHAAKTALETQCAPVIVVLGAHAPHARHELSGLPVHAVDNDDWPSGIGSSLKVGARAAIEEAPELDGLLITLADQPFVTGESLCRLLDAFRRDRPPAVIAAYKNTCGVPAVFNRALLPEVWSLHPSATANGLIDRYRAHSVAIELPEAAADVDTPEEYVRARDTTRKSRRFPS